MSFKLIIKNERDILEMKRFDVTKVIKYIDRLIKLSDYVVKHIIDNVDDHRYRKISRFIFSQCNNKIIKYMIDKKDIDLECQDNEGWRPIHYICRFSTPEMIKYIIDKGVDLDCKNVDGWRPIHLICRFSTPEMIKYIIDKGVDLECQNKKGCRPIHFICRHSTPEMIKYIINKGVNLECQIKNGWRPIHLISVYSTPEMILYMIKHKKVNIGNKDIEYFLRLKSRCYQQNDESVNNIIKEEHEWNIIKIMKKLISIFW
jgi:ankyrin repeat protein